MSRLEELILELCPDGVKWLTVSDICKKISSGGTPKSSNKDFYGGSIPWLRTQDINWRDIYDTTEKITEEGLYNSSANWIPQNCVIVAMYGATAAKVAVNKIPLTTNQACCNLQIDENKALYRYVYYWLSKEYYNLKSMGQGSQFNINAQIIKRYHIPIPPLEVQHEIVRILDSFTELTAELTAELTERKKQYEYYGKELLEQSKNKSVMVPLSSLGKWSSGKTPPMANKEYWENGTVPWISSKDMKTAVLEDTEDHITEKALTEAGMKLLPEGCIAIVTRSGILKHTFPVAYVAFKTTVNQDIKTLVVKDGISSKYIFHVLQAYAEEIRIKTKKQGGTVDSLNFQKVLNYEIPLPSIDIQNRIVNVLDNFESICSDLKIGLPAEIEARQKQFEYYRDKLLTFKEKTA